MKKVLLVMVAMVMMMGVSFADNDILTYQTTNTGGTYTNTAVSVTSIYPTIDQILGYSIMQYNPTKNSENVVALYDQTDTAITLISGECLGEAEALDNADSTIWYPYPRILTTGLLIRQGPNTVVTIYFSRR